SYNIADQLMQDGNVTYQYDVDGYLTQKTDGNDITQYQYSRQGRLLSVQTPTDLIEYRHNAMGNRVAKIVNGQTTEKYLWLDKTTLLATYDGSNTLKQRFEYTLGHAPTSFMQNGNRYYIATDHLGSPRAISDENGSIIKAITYDSYGNVISDSNPEFPIPFGFAGGLQDSDTGLNRFGFRDYDSQTGRWAARDPIGLSGGDNIYGYVAQSPVNWVDSIGLACFDSACIYRAKQAAKTANKIANRQIRDAAKDARIPVDKQRGFRQWVEKIKKDEGRGGGDNYTWDELKELADEFKDLYCK
ncbi:MAG: RHS domain-containing protein, partial [Gammaproteobacteria bacterium]|nr:RHS domain-containing protein [Gammaproteobacteria bacterium]